MRSRDSRDDGKRFVMRLDPQTRQTLEGLSIHFDTSIAEVVRQLVAQATLEDFPRTWPRASGGTRRAYPRHNASPRRRRP
jgi:hypothetical protein